MKNKTYEDGILMIHNKVIAWKHKMEKVNEGDKYPALKFIDIWLEPELKYELELCNLEEGNDSKVEKITQ